MAAARTKEPNSPGKGQRRKDVRLRTTPIAPGSLRPTPRPRQHLFARPAVWLAVASIAVFVAGTGGWLWSRPQFDMVKTLADLVAHEGTWDNPWDLQDKKIASLQDDIHAETNPIKRLILRRELAQQYISGGLANFAVGSRSSNSCFPNMAHQFPPADIETLKADLAYAYFRLGELHELYVESQRRCLHLPNPGRGRAQRTTWRY